MNKTRNDKILVKIVNKYYDDNNYGYSDTWQEQLDRYRVYQVMDKWFFNKVRPEFNLDLCLNDLRNISSPLRRLYKQSKHDAGEWANDRSGEEIYGYENDESIYNNLCYISDRWFCQERLRWMIDLLERKG